MPANKNGITKEIANKIKRSKDYVSKLAVEFDIEIQKK